MAATWLVTAGCSGLRPTPVEELVAFEEAGPGPVEVDRDKLTTARIPAGPYRVVPGDVLELHMPAVTRAAAAELPERVESYLCRVTDAGTIYLPLVAELKASGRTLGEIESAVVAAYHPKYVVRRPSVVARVSEYHTVTVSVTGAVVNPGLHALRSDEMSLVAALMKAGGIVQGGAGVIRIHPPGEGGKVQELALPVKGLNIPFADVALKGGETIEVEGLEPQVFTVMGLVNKPGAFPYPPGCRYNLAQALAFAGGVDDVADPRHAKVYRKDAKGQPIDATFEIAGTKLAQASDVLLKPGDIVAVPHTPRTRTRQALADVFRIGTGAYVGATYNINPGSK